MSNETGTVKETTLYKMFYDYVIGKFESMANFSMIENGDRRKFTRMENAKDTEENREDIWKLHRLAQLYRYDKSLVYISDAERLSIKNRVTEIVKSKGITKVKFFWDSHISISIYKQVVSKLNIFKNESYHKLMKILFE